MSIGLLILILILGLLLIVIEIVVIPGITFAGISGIGLIIVTILLAYINFGFTIGNLVLAGSCITSFSIFFIGYKFFNFKGIALTKKLSESIVKPSHNEINIKIGDNGVAFGDIKPQGNAIINNRSIIVKSKGEFIPDNTEIEVIEVTHTYVVVKPKVLNN
ncbi:MAG: hypothetical protein IPM47_12715 [Sphingobacteriales bacterium]|nr:MAG: hypothetical protein IPM47_12715 [Sphingobacteriales bacterium]